MSPEPFGIYVHWPFCAAKCPYCDFNSHVRASIEEAAWKKSIVRELEYVAGLQGPQRPRVETIFFGGGTPSLMSGKAVASVLDAIGRLWNVEPHAEITLESNPASADAVNFRAYKSAGVNRLSFGVQALNDADLKALGRLHNAAEARAALSLATGIFDRVSLDLIYAREGQTTAAWRAELREALAFGTEHLSLYQLTIEPGTPFFVLANTGKLALPDEELSASLYELTQEMTEAAGRPAYEISNHARPGAECRHNLLYWRYGDYAGVGPGAHGRLTCNRQRFATATERLPERWQAKVAQLGHGFIAQDPVAPGEAAREHLLMALRLREGLDVARYEQRWGVCLDAAEIAALAGAGLLAQSGSRIAATPRGRLLLNRITAALAV